MAAGCGVVYRVCTVGLLAGTVGVFLLVGCGPGDVSSNEAFRKTAEGYVDAWVNGDYHAMWNLSDKQAK